MLHVMSALRSFAFPLVRGSRCPTFPVPLRFSHEDGRAEKSRRSAEAETSGVWPKHAAAACNARAQNTHTQVPLAPLPATSKSTPSLFAHF
uniref:Putative secreted protein n=1 Tax=Ixodes ricinus TaxID=34613 RepID=A0A6B0UAU4_IXORI